MSGIIENPEPFRYERKFIITDYSHSEVEQIIKYHPSCFSEIFHERTVNNIYFDSIGINNYYDNIDGERLRTKIRIRWYGDLFGTIPSPTLEYKIKSGLLGKKESYSLQPFTLDPKFNKVQITSSLGANIPKLVKNEILSLRPTLLNSYKRKYFLSADKNFRITIDHHLIYYGIGYTENLFINKSSDYNSTVLELKYDSSLETDAHSVADKFPFALTRNSKYLNGLERVFI